MTSARKVTDQVGRVIAEVERGKGWAHALIYEEPVALRAGERAHRDHPGVLDRVAAR